MTGLSGTSSFRVGERLIAWSDDGLLGAEYALFDPSEIVLHASDPVSVREAGYMTTARKAVDRLAESGVSMDLATQAAKALRPEAIFSFARGENARAVADELGPQELFDGAIYRAAPELQCYEGTWLDLRALAPRLAIPSAPLLIQVLHLVATLSEVPGDTPLHLSTTGTMRERRPGERTYVRPPLDDVWEMPEVLRKLRPRTVPVAGDAMRDARLHQALLARVRERVSQDSALALRAHLALLDEGLTRLRKPTGPMSDEEVRTIQRLLDERDMVNAGAAIERLERKRGNLPVVRYLKALLALLRGEEPPRSVALRLSEIADAEKGFHQAALVAARTWLAAGEEAHARYFAHKLVDDSSAGDHERLVALEILTTVPVTHRSLTPPSVAAEVVTEIPATARMPRVPRLPSLGDVPLPGPIPSLTGRPPPVSPDATPDLGAAVRPAVRYEPELVESLPLPSGSRESDLGVNVPPSGPSQARVAMTRLARDLARDYRLWYGKTLRCDVIAIDLMQQHLVHRFAGAAITDEAVAWELRRHGALLSEILARKLAGTWLDVGPSEPGYWSMLLGTQTRTHPIGRVYRFVSLGQRERDLISYFIDLEERLRSG
jgi:hypothetical protein